MNNVEPKGDISLTCDEWGTLHCKKVLEEPQDTTLNTTFSLLPALEDGYFSDIKIIADNNKEVSTRATKDLKNKFVGNINFWFYFFLLVCP